MRSLSIVKDLNPPVGASPTKVSMSRNVAWYVGDDVGAALGPVVGLVVVGLDAARARTDANKHTHARAASGSQRL